MFLRLALLPFLILPAEIYLFIELSQRYGFLKIFGLYFLPTFLGFYLLGHLKRQGLRQMQSGSALTLGPKMVGVIFRTLGAVLLLPPFFTNRILGLILLLPGLNYLAVFLFGSWIYKKIQEGQVSFQNGGVWMGGFRKGHQTPTDSPDVIDVSARRQN